MSRSMSLRFAGQQSEHWRLGACLAAAESIYWGYEECRWERVLEILLAMFWWPEQVSLKSVELCSAPCSPGQGLVPYHPTLA